MHERQEKRHSYVLYSRGRYINARETREKTQVPVLYSRGRYINARETREQTQVPVLYSRGRYINARETTERRSYLSYIHTVGTSMHERQEKRSRYLSNSHDVSISRWCVCGVIYNSINTDYFFQRCVYFYI